MFVTGWLNGPTCRRRGAVVLLPRTERQPLGSGAAEQKARLRSCCGAIDGLVTNEPPRRTACSRRARSIPVVPDRERPTCAGHRLDATPLSSAGPLASLSRPANSGSPGGRPSPDRSPRFLGRETDQAALYFSASLLSLHDSGTATCFLVLCKWQRSKGTLFRGLLPRRTEAGARASLYEVQRTISVPL
jgi:hypothetical protein